MATSNNSLNTLVSGADLISKIMGGSSSTTTTGSTQSNISQAGVDRLVQQILAGRGGVRDISGAARGAGLFNSSTEAQMLNDLAARTAGEVEARRAGTTTTQTSETTTPGMDIGNLGLGLGALMLGRPLIERALGLTGDTAATAAGNALPANLSVAPGAAIGGQALGDLTGLSLATSVSPNFAGLGGNILQGAGSLAGAGSGAAGLASDLGLELGVGQGASSAILNTGLDTIPGVGSFLGGLFNGQNGDPFGSPLGLLGSAGAGAAAMGPMGLIAAPVMGLAGALLNDLGLKSIVCTALMKHGLLDPKEYAKGQAYLQTLNPRTIKGYYKLFSGIAKKIEDDKNEKLIKLTLPWARSRTKLIADESKVIKYFKYPLGTITLLMGQPLCYMVGLLGEGKWQQASI